MRRTHAVLLSLAVVLALFAVMPSVACAANADCLFCHTTGGQASSRVDFTVPAVDTSKCNACHWYAVHDFDSQHVGPVYSDYMSRQCASCHHASDTWPVRPQIIGWPTALTAQGWFQSQESVLASAGVIHSIHANGSWLKNNGECASCHGAAACGACHVDPDVTHAEHASLGPRELPVSWSIGKKYGDPSLDTYIYSYAPSGNYDAASTVYVGAPAAGRDQRFLLRFPLAKVAAADFTTATVQLTRSSGTPFPMRAYRLRRTDWVANQASWNNYKTGSAWAVAGAKSPTLDHYADVYAESSSGAFDVTALVRAALAEGDTTLELLVLDPSPVARRYAGFYSSNGVYADWYPCLKVEGWSSVNMYAYGPVAGTEPGSPTVPDYVTTSRSCVAAACHDLAKAGTSDFAPTCATVCHPDRAVTHGYDAAKHTASPADARISVSGIDYGTFACSTCHSLELGAEHDKATSSGNARGCAQCHKMPRESFETWDKSCAQGGCHSPASSKPLHSEVTTDHVRLATNEGCFGTECHTDGNLAVIHLEATATVSGATRSSCGVCHAAGVPAGRDCTVCHPERTQPHGYDPAKHLSDETCLLACHDAELKPAHDAEVSSNVATCSDCHETKVDAIRPWDKTCAACHPTLVADHAPASHVGTDAAVFDISPTTSYFVHGCSDYPDGIPSQTNCHDISSLAVLHSALPDRGCTVCHGTGNSPKRECLDCHREGQATSYEKYDTQEGSVTVYATSDASRTPGWTFTTTPSGGAAFTGVDAPYPPANTAEYTTVTTSTAGGLLFGFERPSIPSNAVITSVQIFAKAQGTNSTYARRMSGWVDIGGQVFTSSNQTGNLPNGAWLGGTGDGQAFALATRYVYDPDYHAISVNPKTGLDWTVDQLTGAGPNSLNAFGVKLTATSVADQPSNVDLAQVYMKIVYEVRTQVGTYGAVGSSIYHHNNAKYLHDPADAAGKRFALDPVPHGWYEALYYQDCYDFCHYGNGGDPTFTAAQGTWMWYSVGGDPYDPVAATRTLTLRPVALPADAPSLHFVTNYQLGTGSAGYVEVSTDDGASWTQLTGNVGGTSVAAMTGNAVGWVPATYDLSTYAGRTVRLRFRYVNGSSFRAGWAFDSLTIDGGGATVYSDDAETLKPDWTNRFWTRAKGAFPY